MPSPHSYNHFLLDQNTNDSSEIQCICGFHHDDGFTIACDQCDTWQHGYCVDIAEDAIPEKYECPNCRPRPVDIRRAKEYQQHNFNERDRDRDRDREEKPRRKKPKSNSTSNPSRRKDASVNAMQSNGPAPPALTDRAAGPGKTTNSKELNSRKRGSNRASVSTKSESNNNYLLEPVNGAFTVPVGVAVSSAPSPAMTTTTDRNPEGESDTDMEKPQLYGCEFMDITDGKDHIADKGVQTFVKQMNLHHENVRRFTTEEVASATTAISVVNSTSYSLPQYFITIDNSCLKGQLVALCKGEIIFKESYKADAINQYGMLRHPKPCVFFHPSQPICIDSRIRGSPSRYVKRSCRPNTELATIIVDNAEVMFGLFATEPLEPGTTLTVGWEWSGSRAMQKLLIGAEPDNLDYEEYQDALCWVNTLTSHIGDCACVDKDECVFSKLKVKRESSPPKPVSRIRRGSRATQEYSSTPVSNQGSPERQISSDRDEGSRSSKSRSRDLSPQSIMHEEMSGREARKMQELLSRFERIEQADQAAGGKRRKRNNTISVSTVNFTETVNKAEVMRKGRTSSVAVSPPPFVKSGSDMPAPPTRKSSVSLSLKSDDSRLGRVPMQPPPAPVKKARKPEYVDSAMQTDESVGVSWNISTSEVLVTPSRVSFKERLMQSMLREREKAVALESRKRKQSEISDTCPSPTESYKEQKLQRESDVKSPIMRSSPQMETTDMAVDDGPIELVNTPPEFSDETPMTSVSPCDVKPMDSILTTQPRGPALADIFADSPPTPVVPQEHILDDQRTPPISPKSTAINSPRTPSLQIQTGPAFPTAPATPSPMPASTSSPSPSIPGANSQSPLAASATNTAFPTSALTAISTQGSQMNSMSTPAKTKKMSLSEYGRRKKVDYNDKKALMSAVSE